MYCKLAFRNVRRSIRDYLIYFLTLTFGICIFYIFNSIESQQAMLAVTENEADVFDALTKLMGYVSIMVTIILGFLILYANRFLIRRRKKEMGVYLILGMDRSRVALILMMETFFIGIFSLSAGLLAGIFLSQGMAFLTARLFSVSFVSFVFVFSKTAFLKTLLYFSLIYMMVMFFNTLSISGVRLIDLLTAERKNESLTSGKLWHAVVLFILSVLCLCISYYLITKNGMLNINREFAASLLFGIAGTLLFFRSLSGFLLRLCQSARGIYLKGLNAFILRQLNSKINTTWISMSIICIMLLITIGTLSSAIGLADVLTRGAENSTPYDITVSMYVAESDFVSRPFPDELDALSAYTAAGLDLDNIADINETHIHDSGLTYSDLDPDYYSRLDNSLFDAESIDSLSASPVPAVALKDFNEQLIMQGEAPVSIAENEFLLCYNFDSVRYSAEKLADSTRPITVAGHTLTSCGQPLLISTETVYSAMNPGMLVVPDTVAQSLPSITLQIDVNLKTVNTDTVTAFTDNFYTVRADAALTDPDNFLFSCPLRISDRLTIESSNFGLKIITSYIGIYIGLIFLIASAAVLALQQLSDASDNQGRYALLRKLGTEEGMLRRALITQIALYFFLPLALAIVHAVVGIRVANAFIAIFASVNVASNSLMTTILLLIIYGGYFVCTCLSSLAMLRES